uniref:TF-B3 domain-containing protein n=1 Tax=Oryza glumipatula TaxID=40148 RepID=A0A0D9ZJ79_9ORYZ
MPGDHAGAGAAVGAAAKAMQLKVLMPSSFHKMHISDELAAHLLGERGDGGGGGAARRAARVVSPVGKIWDVEVGRDGDGDGGAFLGRGWAEFAAAHGLGVGWFVVVRHEGGGVLTVKLFDTTCCLKDFAAPPAGNRSKDYLHAKFK